MNNFYLTLKKLFTLNHHRIIKFILVGGSAAVINLALVYALIDIGGLDTFLLRNIVNVVTMIISTAYAFIFNRKWTWHGAPRKNGNQLLKQYFLYNFITLGGIMIRVILFALLDLLGLYHLFNVAIGISVAAIFNFKMYDKHIFQEGHSNEAKQI